MFKVDSQFLTYRLFYRGDQLDADMPKYIYPLPRNQPVAGSSFIASITPRGPVAVVHNDNDTHHNHDDNDNGTAMVAAGSVARSSTGTAAAMGTRAGAETGNPSTSQWPSLLPLHRPTVATIVVTAGTRLPAVNAAKGNAGSNYKNDNDDPSQVEIEAMIGKDGAGRKRSSDEDNDDDDDDNDNDDRASKKRMALIHEISEHLDVLNKLRGVVPSRDLDARRNILFQALPMPK